jgi:hypothetical protein
VSEAPPTGPEPGPPTPAPSRSGTPGRYQRSTNGLIGALLVTVLAILAFVGFRALNRDQPEIEPTPVDYLGAAQGAQANGFDVVYPAKLPDGWIADSVHLTPGDRPSWGIGMLTDEQRFVGVRQADSDLDVLLHTYVDENPTEGDPVTLPGSVGKEWRTFSDSGGDHALATELGRQWVLVYGSADVSDLHLIAEDLTTDPL